MEKVEKVIGVDASRAFEQERTGTENYSYQVLKAMLALEKAKGYKWVIFVRKGEGEEARGWVAKNGVRGEVVEIGWHRLWTQGGLARETWRRKIDVLWVPAHTLPLLAKPGITKIVTIHGVEYRWLPEYDNPLQRWYLPLSTKWAVRLADRVIAVSQFTKRQLVDWLGVDERKIKVVWEGAEGEFFSKKRLKRDIEMVKQKFAIREPYMMFVGSLQPRKNLPFAMEVVAELRRRGRKIQFVIVGKEGWQAEEIWKAPKKLGIEEAVIFAGWVDDEEMVRLLQGAAVYVQPSITEGFGLPVVEAMAAGCPVVVSNGGALPELVREGEWQVAEVNNKKDWVEKIERVLVDKKLRARLIKEGRERAKELSWQRTAEQTLAILGA